MDHRGTVSLEGSAINRETTELAAARSRLWKATAFLVLVLLVGTISYWRSRGGPVGGFLYTLRTLAYLTKANEGSDLFIQLFLLHAGTVVTWYIGWLLVDLLMEAHFTRHWKEMRRMKVLENLSGHVVICGGGRVGGHVASLLASRGEPFAIVEKDPERVDALKGNGWLVLEGDARDEERLRLAGAERARLLVSALPDTEANVIVVLAARCVNGKLEIDARCDRPDFVAKLKQAGADRVTMPERACAEQMVGALAEPPARSERRAG